MIVPACAKMCQGDGNTRHPPNAALHWCFTLNNYIEEDIKDICAKDIELKRYIFQEEIGENGTPHVVIFSNSYPEMNKLSRDRWEIIELK